MESLSFICGLLQRYWQYPAAKLHGIKALRKCAGVKPRGCGIKFPEFGWPVRGISMGVCD